MFRQTNSRSKINRSRRGVFSAVAKSTLGQQSTVTTSRNASRRQRRRLSHSAESSKAGKKSDSVHATRGRQVQKRQSCSADSSQLTRKSGSARGKPPKYENTDQRKKQQKQEPRHRSRMGDSVAMVFNDSLNDDLYMSFHSNRANSANRSSKNVLNYQKQSIPRRLGSQSMTASQFFLKDASGTPASGLYDVFDDDSMFMSGSSMDLSDSGETTTVIKDFDSEAVANLVRQFISVGDERVPKAISIARKIRELSDYNLFSDEVLDGSSKSSSNLIRSRQKSSASILSTRPW